MSRLQVGFGIAAARSDFAGSASQSGRFGFPSTPPLDTKKCFGPIAVSACSARAALAWPSLEYGDGPKVSRASHVAPALRVLSGGGLIHA